MRAASLAVFVLLLAATPAVAQDPDLDPALKAEQKSSRDARYAARKARSR